MKYLVICFILTVNILEISPNNDFIGWNEKKFQFKRCERTYDKSYVTARDAKYYNFIFKKPEKTFDKFQFILCLDFFGSCENITLHNSQEINCQHQNRDELLCPLIKGFLLDPLKDKGVLNTTLNVYGINGTNEKHFLFKKVLELHKYYLRGCMKYADIVKLNTETLKVKYDIEQLQFDEKLIFYQLVDLPGRTIGLFNHFHVYVTLFNSFNKHSMGDKNLYLDLSNKENLNKNDEYTFVPKNSTCLSEFNQICINATWDFNPKNSTTRWQAVKHCTDFSYTQDFPKFSLRCNPNITTQLTIAKSSDVKSIDPNIFYFQVDVKDKLGRIISVINTTNLTITTNSPYYELSLCDKCQCGKSFKNCEQLSKPVPSPNSENGDNITISVAVLIPMIIVLGICFYRRYYRSKKNDNEPIQPNTDENYVYDYRYSEHPYYDPVTQSEKIVRVAIPNGKSNPNDTIPNDGELVNNSYAYPEYPERTEEEFDTISTQNENNKLDNNAFATVNHAGEFNEISNPNENNLNQYDVLDINCFAN